MAGKTLVPVTFCFGTLLVIIQGYLSLSSKDPGKQTGNWTWDLFRF